MNTCLSSTFHLLASNYKVWNQKDLITFLSANQGNDICLDTLSEGYCLHSVGVYDLLDQFEFSSVTITTNNAIEFHHKYNIQIDSPFRFFKLDYSNKYQQVSHWSKQYKFGCFYNRPLWHRLGIASELLYNYNDSALVNIRCSTQSEDDRNLFEIQELFSYAPESFDLFAKENKNWPIQLEDKDGYTIHNNTNGHTDQLLQWYPNFLIDIVGETWINGRTFFLTEKSIRPMLLKKPMIVMGPAGTLEYLRQMGFRTFFEFWDEDYDGYSMKQRYQKILQLIKDLNQLSTNELYEMYQQMQPILEHNLNLLKTQTYNTNVIYLED